MHRKTNVKRNILLIATISIGMGISGCAAIHTAVKKRNLDVQTKMSETIFLEPSSPNERNVFLSVRNTSDKQIDVEQSINSVLQARGYSIITDPKRANYMIQANILQVGKSDLRTAEGALGSGFGGALAGAAIGGYSGNSGRSVLAGGLLGAAAGIVGDALVDDTYFVMITDVQIRERPLAGETVTQSQQTNANQGSSTYLNQQVSGANVDWKTYRTRVVSTANQANLDFEDAKAPLQDGLVRSISGML